LLISWLILGVVAGSCGRGADESAGSSTPIDPAAAAAAQADAATTATIPEAELDIDQLDPTQIRGEPINQYDLVLGDCFDRVEGLRAGRKVEITSRIDCAETHQYEVFHTLQYPATHPAIYPGDDAMTDYGLNACYQQFESFVGEIYELSVYEIGVFTPNRDNFEHSVARYRGITCWLFRDDLEPTEGSARDSAT
jgi:hypothetical protein